MEKVADQSRQSSAESCRELFSISCSSEAFLKWGELLSSISGTSFLYSGGSLDCAERSYLFLLPFQKIEINSHGNAFKLENMLGEYPKVIMAVEDPWEALKDQLKLNSSLSVLPEWVGFFSYEMGAFADFDKKVPYYNLNLPFAYFQRSACLAVHDKKDQRAIIYINTAAEEYLTVGQFSWLKQMSGVEFWQSLLGSNEIKQSTTSAFHILQDFNDLSTYTDKILRIKEYIKAGEIYQVNLSHKLTLQGSCAPFQLFCQLATLNPAPFSAYLSTEDWTIISSSPERFLKHRGGTLESRPIKGTMPRGANLLEDEQSREELLVSPKERSELLMITDLMRNDLGRISMPGSVETVEIARCEAYTNVFHLLSIIRAVADSRMHPIDFIRSAFPGGSITGCPKLRAMEVIAELESKGRGIYTGSIGYFCGNGDFDFNIAIRTLLMQGDKMEVQLGGGIVYDSQPIKEYEETMHKGESLFKVLGVK